MRVKREETSHANPHNPDDSAVEENSAAPESDAISTFRPQSYRDSLVLAWYRLINRFHLGVSAVYVGVASLIGVDALVLVLGAAAIWPVGIAVAVAVLALVYFLREWLRTFWRRCRSRR